MTLVRKSALAGVLIALASIAFVRCENKYIGAGLFSIGLIAVIILETNLFTGKIGYVNSLDSLTDSGIILIVNLVSAFLFGLIVNLVSGAQTIMVARLNKSFLEILVDSIICGMCIYIAVECYKKTKSMFTVIIPVIVFIIAGGEHCVADATYFGLSIGNVDPLKSCLFLDIVIIGNSIGSLLIRFLQIGFKKENKNELHED